MPSIVIPMVTGIVSVTLLVHSAATPTEPPQSVRQVAALRTARAAHTATTLLSGQVLVAGGMAEGGGSLSSIELFDPETTRCRRLDRSASGGPATRQRSYPTGGFCSPASMTNLRYKIAGTSILLPRGDVLVTAGAPVAELLDVRSWSFREIPGRLPAAYHFAASALLRGGDVFVAGGYSDANKNTPGSGRFERP